MSSSIYLRNLSDWQSPNSKLQHFFPQIMFYRTDKNYTVKKKKKVNCFMWNYGMNVGLKAVSSNFYFSMIFIMKPSPGNY